jgi:hypothetical protein
MTNVIDLTNISVNFKLEFDTLDAVLLVTTGGLGYLARHAYNHFNGKAARDLDLQRQNFIAIVDEALQKGATRVVLKIHPDVPIYAPAGGNLRYLARHSSYHEVEVTFG